jgi:PTS system nitrogen regulatory IIA component
MKNFLDSTRVLLNLEFDNKESIFKFLSEKISMEFEIPKNKIVDSILRRESVGSTYIGNQLALPHGRLLWIKSPIGIFCRLNNTLNYDENNHSAKYVFLSIIPYHSNEKHLNLLSKIASIFSDPYKLDFLSNSDNKQKICALFNS